MVQIEKKPMDRKNRKSSFDTMGRERFNFVEKDEFLRYKYLCGERIGIIQWYTKCCDGHMSYTYYEWENVIKKKYEVYTVQQLNEFEKYLELGNIKHGIHEVLDNIVYAALVSSFLAVIFSNIVVEVAKKGDYFIEFMVLILICFASAIIISFIFYSLKKKVLKKQMYQDYKSVIKSLCHEKTK